jgi:hypothetical protein
MKAAEIAAANRPECVTATYVVEIEVKPEKVIKYDREVQC